MTKEDRLKLFANELGDIEGAALKQFAENLITNAPDYFFTVAASSSGKYHPSFDLGNGGLVRHTRCVVFFAECVAESMDFNSHDKDLLIIAALAHDMIKQGPNDGYGRTVREHPEHAKNYILEKASEYKGLITEEDANKIAAAVFSHMGKWENQEPFIKGKAPYPMPDTDVEKALQIADYIASRKEILGFNFRPTEKDGIFSESTSTAPIVENKEPKQLTLKELESYTLGFGKNKGKTLKEVKPTGYLDWMISQTDFFNKEAQDMARAYIEALRKSVTSSGREEKVKEKNAAMTQPTSPAPVDDDEDLPF